MAERGGYSLRKLGTIIDVGHIVIGFAVLVLAVFAFMNPQKNRALFPIIFFLAAVLNLGTGIYTLMVYRRASRRRVQGMLYIVVGVLIFALFVVSAITIWGGR